MAQTSTTPALAGRDTGESIPVLISGAGPVGLTMSILLSRQGIRNLVIEKRGGIGTLPRARGITMRTVEILSQFGLAEEIDAISLPPLWTRNFVYTETLGGEVIGVMPTIMGPGACADYTPCDYRVAAQDRIDPMLCRHASGYDESEIRFNTELRRYTETSAAIVATVADADGETSNIRAEFLVAADGARSLLRKSAGIGETGRVNLSTVVTAHVRADLSPFTEGREGALIWTLAPGCEGVFQNLDGDKQWAVQIQIDPTKDRADAWSERRVIATLRTMIGDTAAEDTEIEVLNIYTYTLSTVISDHLRKGRLLLVGDAAHQVPPYGGFGMNTGIQSAHNLAWKLGAVLRGEAPEALLDTYERERREVAQRVCDFGRTNAGYVEKLMQAIRNASSVDEKRAIFVGSRQFGNWLGLDLGVHYERAGAFVPDDAPIPDVANPIVDFVPHAKPGHRAPHLWVKKGDERLSTVMLFDGAFVLLAGEAGADWIDAAHRLDDPTLPAINAYRVAPDGDLVAEGNFCRLYGITEAGAVLVRPDGHVGFRAPAGVPDAAAALGHALDQILQRSPVDPH